MLLWPLVIYSRLCPNEFRTSERCRFRVLHRSCDNRVKQTPPATLNYLGVCQRKFTCSTVAGNLLLCHIAFGTPALGVWGVSILYGAQEARKDDSRPGHS